MQRADEHEVVLVVFKQMLDLGQPAPIAVRDQRAIQAREGLVVLANRDVVAIGAVEAIGELDAERIHARRVPVVLRRAYREFDEVVILTLRRIACAGGVRRAA